MRTGKGMLDQRLRTLSLSYAHVELAKFRFRKGAHRRLRRLQAVKSAEISRSVNPASWQSWIKARRSTLEDP